MKSLMELLIMIKNLEISQKNSAKVVKHVPLKGNERKFADLLKNLKKEVSMRKEKNLPGDSRLQKAEIPRELLFEIFSRSVGGKKEVIGEDSFKNKEESQPSNEERRANKKSHKSAIDEDSKLEVRIIDEEKTANKKIVRNEKNFSHKVDIRKKMFEQVLSDSKKGNHVEELKSDFSRMKSMETPKRPDEVEKQKEDRSDEVQKSIQFSKQNQNRVMAEERIVSKKTKESIERSVSEKDQHEKVKNQEGRYSGPVQKVKSSTAVLKAKQHSSMSSKEAQQKDETLILKMKLPEKEEEMKNENKDGNDVEIRNSQNPKIKERIRMISKGPIKNEIDDEREFTSVSHKKARDIEGSSNKTEKMAEKQKKLDTVDSKETVSSDKTLITSIERNVEKTPNTEKIKNVVKKEYIFGDEKKHVKEHKNVKKTEVPEVKSKQNIRIKEKSPENVLISENLIKESRKVVSHGEEVVEKVIEVVRKSGDVGYIEEVKVEKIVRDDSFDQKRVPIQNQRDFIYSGKSTNLIKKESFLRRLNVKTMRMEVSKSKSHYIEVERNASIKQSSERIKSNEEIEKTKDIIVKHTAQKRYGIERKLYVNNVNVQDLSRTKDAVEVKIDSSKNEGITLDKVIEKVKEMIQKRTERAIVQLEPPRLGKMEVEILKEGEDLRIILKVSTNEAREVLERGSKYLVARLENLGFRIEDIQIKETSEGSYDEEGEHQNGENDLKENRGGEDKRRKFREIFKRKVSEK